MCALRFVVEDIGTDEEAVRGVPRCRESHFWEKVRELQGVAGISAATPEPQGPPALPQQCVARGHSQVVFSLHLAVKDLLARSESQLLEQSVP